MWNLCPKGLASNDGCSSTRRTGCAALHASLNPDYRDQRPMFETIRSDVLRGAFGPRLSRSSEALRAGVEHPKFSAPQDLEAYDKQGPYKTMADATGDHGIVEEIMAFFVAPVTGYYSFLTWGDQEQDVWLSQSSDPADLVKASEASECDVHGKVAMRFDYQPCRTSTRHMFTGCSMLLGHGSGIWPRVDFTRRNRIRIRSIHGHISYRLDIDGSCLIQASNSRSHTSPSFYNYRSDRTRNHDTPIEAGSRIRVQSRACL